MCQGLDEWFQLYKMSVEQLASMRTSVVLGRADVRPYSNVGGAFDESAGVAFRALSASLPFSGR